MAKTHNKKIFLFEFISGGGMADVPLPASLVQEGELMVAALLRDFAELPEIQIVLARDTRLPPRVDHPLWVDGNTDLAACLKMQSEDCDAVWLIAPEFDGILENLTRIAESLPWSVLTTPWETVRLAASKWRTHQALAAVAGGVNSVPTYRPSEWQQLSQHYGAWVVKPEDGAGAQDTWYCANADIAQQKLTRRPGLVVQPWVAGEARSLCLLATEQEAKILSVNRQQLEIADQALHLAGLAVNIATPTPYQPLAHAIHQAMPGLRGAVGVDFVEQDGHQWVVDVNPRYTTSCTLLQQALGLNLAAEVLGAFGMDVCRKNKQEQRNQIARLDLTGP